MKKTVTVVVEQRCHAVEDVLHGSYEVKPADRRFGSIVHYVCNQGYILVGQTHRYCQGDHRWSGSAPVCELEGTVRVDLLEHTAGSYVALHDCITSPSYQPIGHFFYCIFHKTD